jgi:hypothetical protein
MKYVISGMARSGTTIVNLFFHSLPKSFSFFEPHYEYLNLNTTTQFKGLEKYGKFNPDVPMPVDKIMSSMISSERYNMVGFKETYKGTPWENHSQNLFNKTLLNKYKKHGYKFIYVLRNPIESINSRVFRMTRKHFVNYPKITVEVEKFTKNFYEFISEFMDSNIVIFFDEFIVNPKKSVTNIFPKLNVPNDIDLKYYGKKIGDQRALKSNKIEPKGQKKITLNEDYVKMIKDSKGYEIYMNLRKKSS